MKEIFEEIYRKGIWNHNKPNIPKSGPGSSIENAQNSIELLNYIVKKEGIQSVLDLGCGDLNWIVESDVFNLDYSGYDIAETIINANKIKYPDKTFECKDITNDELENADMVIIRDVIFHLKIDDILSLIRNLTKYKFKYIFITTCRNTKNIDTLNIYHYHTINLEIEPFNIKKYLYKRPENVFNRDIMIIDFNYLKSIFEPK